MNSKAIKYFIIGTFVSLYLVVSVISTIHVVQFFDLSNPKWLSISLAIAFELGAAASLASIIALDKMNKFMVWGLFITLTLMQAMGNSYYAYSNIHDYSLWSELFGLSEEEPIFQKRILSIISGAILPLVALGFIKSLVDYIKPDETKNDGVNETLDEQDDQIIPQVDPANPDKDVREVMDPAGEETEPQEETQNTGQPDAIYDQVNPINYVNSNHRNIDYGPDPTVLK
jgi:hypothetical protein